MKKVARQFASFLATTIACLFVSLLISLPLALFEMGTNVLVFLIWSVFHAATIAAMARAGRRLPIYEHSHMRSRIAALLSILAGLGWAILMGLFYGATLRVLNLPTVLIWSASGYVVLRFAFRAAAGEMGRAQRATAGSWKALPAVSLLAFACPVASLLTLLAVSGIEEALDIDNVYLLPDGYVGPALIIYGQADAPPTRREGREYIFEIPDDGVLRTQTTADTTGGEFWYVDAQGNKTGEIMWGGGCVSDLPGDPLVVCSHGGLRRFNGELAPRHSYLIIGPQSRQRELLRESGEWHENILKQHIEGD